MPTSFSVSHFFMFLRYLTGIAIFLPHTENCCHVTYSELIKLLPMIYRILKKPLILSSHSFFPWIPVYRAYPLFFRSLFDTKIVKHNSPITTKNTPLSILTTTTTTTTTQKQNKYPSTEQLPSTRQTQQLTTVNHRQATAVPTQSPLTHYICLFFLF